MTILKPKYEYIVRKKKKKEKNILLNFFFYIIPIVLMHTKSKLFSLKLRNEIREIFYSIDAMVDLFFPPEFPFIKSLECILSEFKFPWHQIPLSPSNSIQKTEFSSGNSRNLRTFHPLFILNNHRYVIMINLINQISAVSRVNKMKRYVFINHIIFVTELNSPFSNGGISKQNIDFVNGLSKLL